MERSMIFWMLMILWLLSAAYGAWPGMPQNRSVSIGGSLLLFVLLGLLGWSVFGDAVK